MITVIKNLTPRIKSFLESQPLKTPYVIQRILCFYGSAFQEKILSWVSDFLSQYTLTSILNALKWYKTPVDINLDKSTNNQNTFIIFYQKYALQIFGKINFN